MTHNQLTSLKGKYLLHAIDTTNDGQYLCLDGWKHLSEIDENYPPLQFDSREEAENYCLENEISFSMVND